MLKKSWLLLLPLVTGFLWTGATPSQAAGEDFRITSLDTVGCDNANINLGVDLLGFDGGAYTFRTRVTAGGRTYIDRSFDAAISGPRGWTLSDPTAPWPIPGNTQVTVVISVERPQGTVITAAKLVLSGCNSGTIRYNGSVSDDVDDDLVPAIQDACPNLRAFTENGCPTRSRTLSMGAKHAQRRVTGRLSSGYPALDAGRTVSLWKVHPGPDRKVRTLITNGNGGFTAKVRKGRYYATSAGLIAPSSGQVDTSTSPVVRVR
jgi:hypothetical protein